MAGSGGDEPAIHEVPFELVRRQVLVDVMVEGGGPFVMHLDTAVSPSGLDLEVAEAVGLATGPEAGFVAGFGNRRIPYRNATVGELSIGGFRFTGLETIVWDSSHLQLHGLRLMGTLGQSFFRRTWVQIDYPARIVRFRAGSSGRDASSRPCPQGSEPLEADLSSFPRLLDVRVEDQPIVATLDTGASGGLHLPLATARRLGLGERWASAERVEAHGARGAFEARKTHVDSLEIGGFEIRDVETLISPTATSVLVGNGALEELVLTVDYPGGHLCLGRS